MTRFLSQSELQGILMHRKVVGNLLEKISEEPKIELPMLFSFVAKESNVPLITAGMIYHGICMDGLIDYDESGTKILTEKGRKFISY